MKHFTTILLLSGSSNRIWEFARNEDRTLSLFGACSLFVRMFATGGCWHRYQGLLAVLLGARTLLGVSSFGADGKREKER